MTANDSNKDTLTQHSMTGAEALVESLVRQGVDVVFAYPGGASMPIHQALSKESRIRTILPRHEQGGGFAAEGYGRATGKVGVCISTSGPGATNMITPIADAYLDSTPMVAITAQVVSSLIGRGAFQETDVFGMTAPIVKHSYLVTKLEDIPRVINEAFYLAQSGRPGPVVIDIPKDFQEGSFVPDFDDEKDLPGYDPNVECPSDRLKALVPLILSAKRPAIYAGGGVISAEASDELVEFAELAQIPVATSLMGIGAMPETHPLSVRWLGMHGAVYANNTVNEADLVIALGARFDDRVTGAVSKFCPDATIVHVDIDASEINKNKKVKYPVRANVKDALQVLNAELKALGCKRERYDVSRRAEWFRQIEDWKEQYPLSYEERDGYIAPQTVIEELYRQTAELDPIITTGVGQHQMFAAQFYKFDKPRRLATSGGLGSMGYGLPAAMGVQMAYPDRLVVNIDGDGSFLMNVQELATIKVERMPIKCLVLNNQHLGMVVQWEDLKYDSNRAQTFLADAHDDYDPTHQTPEVIYPDFPTLCAGFGIKCERVTRQEDLAAAIARMIASPEAYVLDVMVPYDVHVLPLIPGGMSYKDVLLERIAGDGKGRKASDLGKTLPSAL
ncbi:biosynthetic-type acetolactate synthase large subunit [Akkermansia glycaniphila]|uniref:Acetolactate synthase n=1 Tax=Akkermansia glycaniphila TaxID=1679444 RepID=A0A1C7PAS3_9BACT|nr:biosynthetic-type acetolactate synthase large subunit [Akkermansia glycaniphila]OCA02696.1 acetolactate synthase catalytic subunit [Akkermansia glycaniphila]SEH77109.1 acolac lg: acetolactate synthase large subunit biosynthetic type [Akkermansia glycaniphila]